MRARVFSTIYRAIRRLVIRQIYRNQHQQNKPVDLEDAILFGNQAMAITNRWLGKAVFNFGIPKHINTQLYDLSFKSPLTAASFNDSTDLLQIWLRMGLGGVCLKTIMPQERKGNPRPRIQEVIVNHHPSLLNAMGLPGKGVEGLINDLKSNQLLSQSHPVGISIGGTTIAEYQLTLEKIDRFINQDPSLPVYYEINISCPNTPEGQQITHHPELLSKLLTHARGHTDRVIGVKLSPDQSDADLQTFAELTKSIPRTYLNIGNTTYRACRDVQLPTSAISIGGGGLSGPHLYKRTLEMVQLLQPFNIPLIATGGISTSAQAAHLLKSGATLIEMATALIMDPYCIPIINRELATTQ